MCILLKQGGIIKMAKIIKRKGIVIFLVLAITVLGLYSI